MKFHIVILTLTFFNCAKCQSNRCYQLEDNPFSFFASKTPYRSVSSKQNYTQQNCKALQIWLLNRHGTRYPASVVIDNMYGLYKYRNNLNYKSELCQADIEAIKEWDFNLTEASGNMLNSQGVIELSSLGLRLKNAYDDIFNESYNSTTYYKIISSPKSRCVDSASSFLKSAFNINNVDIPIMKSDDIRLNVSKFKEVHDEDHMKEIENIEVQKFSESMHMQNVIFSVSKSLGLDRNLTLKTVKLLYESCRYEKAWYINARPAWCAVFSKEDLEVLEYAEDLKHYYLNGYGTLYNERLGCPIVKDLITNFRSKAQTRLGPKGIFYFGHSSNVLSVIVRLGFAKDSVPLLASNFKEMYDRKWRMTKLNPFASNVMVVLYECPNGKKVTFFVNEVPVVMEKHNCTLCPWELIEKTYDPIVSNPACTFDETSSASMFSKKLVLFFLTYFCVFHNP